MHFMKIDYKLSFHNFIMIEDCEQFFARYHSFFNAKVIIYYNRQFMTNYSQQQNIQMERIATFKFTVEQLKKINGILPKGYKFVVREELQKKDISKTNKKKALISIPPDIITPPQSVSQKIKIMQVRDEQFEPKRKYVPPAAINLALEGPSITSQKLLQKLRKHYAFNSLFNLSKIRESDLSLREIEQKIFSEVSYKIADLEIDIQNFCLMVYKNFAKTAQQYREAAQLENYLATLIKFEKSFQAKKIQPPVSLIRSSSISSVNQLRRRPFPTKSSIYQPLIQIRSPMPSEKRMLGQMIKKLPSQSLQQVCYIVYESTQNKEYIFDLDTLHVKKFRQLEEYVKKCMQKTGEWDQRNYDDEQFSNQSQFVIDDDND